MRGSYVFLNILLLGAILLLAAAMFLIFGKISEDKKELQNYQEIIFQTSTGSSQAGPSFVAPTAEDIFVQRPQIISTSTSDVIFSSTTKEFDAEVDVPPTANLAIPFTSQAPQGNWDQPWQDACEEAAILMMDAYYKGYGLSPLFARDELQKMVDWEVERGWGGSINILQIKEVLDHYMVNSLQTTDNGNQPSSVVRSLSSNIVENPSVEDIKRYIANGTPVLVVADGKKLPNPNFQNGGPVYHALIIRGYTESTFITNDPGTRNGEAFEYAYDDLMNAIGDWNDGNPSEGRNVVLVVE